MMMNVIRCAVVVTLVVTACAVPLREARGNIVVARAVDLADLSVEELGNVIELARRLRAQPQTNGTVLVAVTGWGKEEDRQRSREAGFDLHLVKPVEPDQILDEVRKAGAKR